MHKNDLEPERTNYWYWFSRRLNHAYPELAVAIGPRSNAKGATSRV